MTFAATNIARVVKTFLANQDKTQGELASYMHVTPGVISKKLAGRSAITADDIEAFARFFDASPAVFFEDPATIVRNRWFLPAALVAS